jgi:hypothetical protein
MTASEQFDCRTVGASQQQLTGQLAGYEYSALPTSTCRSGATLVRV